MEIQGVRVLTFAEFAAETVGSVIPNLKNENGELKRPSEPAPRSIDRVKRSMAVLQVLEEYAKGYSTRTTWRSYEHDLITVLSQTRAILAQDETKLIDQELIDQAYKRSLKNLEQGVCDAADDALLLRLIELKSGGITFRTGEKGKYHHIAADEIQDFAPTELACIVGAVDKSQNLTLVGDTSQRLDEHNIFPGWEKLKSRWAFKSEMSKYITLSVSHRSTLPIMRFAEHIQGCKLVTDGRQGRVPIWFRCRRESDALSSTRDWLNKALEKYSNSLTAVLCATAQEAKFVLSLLEPTFGNVIRLGDDYSFSFDAGIIVAPVKVVKGLEFTNVVIWNPTDKNYPASELSKNMLYVAATRAEENLCLVTCGRPSPLLPGFNSPLIRAMDLRFEEEETQVEARE